MAEAAREQALHGFLEGTRLGISRLRTEREPLIRSPARNEIRVAGTDQLVRVLRHDDPAAPAGAGHGQPARYASEADANTIPTLHAVVNADEGWHDAGFFNVRLQRRAQESQSRVVVRHIDRTGASGASEADRWTGPSIEAAATWMNERALAAAAPAVAQRARHVPCTLTITQAYAYQDPEEIDPHPLDAERVNAGVALAADTPLTLAIALTLGAPAAAEERAPRRCRVAVYAKTFPTGAQAEIGAHVLDVNPAMDNWVARVPIKGLSAGKYRMTIVATLEAPYGGIAHREIPLVRVS